MYEDHTPSNHDSRHPAGHEPFEDDENFDHSEVAEVPEVSLTVEEELNKLLEENQTRLGDVYRRHVQNGLTPQEVAEELNVGTSGFVYNTKHTITAVLEGTYSDSETLRKSTASAIRSLLRSNRSALSAEAVSVLEQRVRDLERLLADSPTVANTAEIEEDQVPYQLEDLHGKEGIYAFSYGWYLENPVDSKMNTTLIKVGRSINLGKRIKQHQTGARAHLPEPLVVVRAYSTSPGESEQAEKYFHRLLATAGHGNPRRSVAKQNEVGKEWFMTNIDFLDAVAMVLGLRTEFIGESDFAV